MTNTANLTSNQTALQAVMHTVFIEGDAVKTNSRFVAEVFGKQHKNVLRDINNLDCSEEFNGLNFEPVKYTDAKGEVRPMVDMTFDGFTFLVMGFTGAVAAQFKEAYITEFNRMRAELLKQRDEEIAQLKKYAKLPIQPLDEKRTQRVLDLLAERMPIVDIARVCRVSQNTVRLLRDKQARQGDLFGD